MRLKSSFVFYPDLKVGAIEYQRIAEINLTAMLYEVEKDVYVSFLQYCILDKDGIQLRRSCIIVEYKRKVVYNLAEVALLARFLNEIDNSHHEIAITKRN